MRCEDFIALLASASGGVQVAHREVLDEWRPEEPPATILFASLGDRIAEDFGRADIDTNHRIFSLIERAMESGDEQLVTAVATGLIEALVTRAVHDSQWPQMMPFLGPRSLHHAAAWLAIC